jgi:stage II sporulation protein GA (sporulation sigma-E factor processing peptidase)
LTIYLDAVWLLNFCIDGFLLLLCAFILKRKVAKWRLISGALFGSTIILLFFTPFDYLFTNPFTKLSYSIGMVFITFGYKRFRYFLQSLLTFYFSAFMIGGGLLGIHYLFQTQANWSGGAIVTQTKGLGDPVGWGLILIGFPILWYFSKNQMEEAEAKKIHFDQLVKIAIKIENINVSMIGLIDSGNQLYDPLTKKPVMIADASIFQSHLSTTFLEGLKNIENLSDDQYDHPFFERLKIIPYRGVGQDHQFLTALKPDEVMIEMDGEKLSTNQVLIGLNFQSLSSDGEYDCILHPRMITGAKVLSAS